MVEHFDRRSGRDRRDWDIFTHPDRRTNGERRLEKDRRKQDRPYNRPDRRRKVKDVKESNSSSTETSPKETISQKTYYSTAEVAKLTGLSQPTLLLWIRNKVIDGKRIKRSGEGRRLWTKEDIEEIRRIKTRNGWTS